MDRILYITRNISYNADTSPNEINVIDSADFDNDNDDENIPKDRTPPKGTCISCLNRFCDIVLLPCFHIDVCSDCWNEKVKLHQANCEMLHKNNRKKLANEKKKIECPCCNNIVSKSNEFHMASIQ